VVRHGGPDGQPSASGVRVGTGGPGGPGGVAGGAAPHEGVPAGLSGPADGSGLFCRRAARRGLALRRGGHRGCHFRDQHVRPRPCGPGRQRRSLGLWAAVGRRRGRRGTGCVVGVGAMARVAGRSRRRSGKKRDFPAAGGRDEDAFPVKIVISGYYGFGNAGDEAILEAMVRDLRALAPGARLVVLSADPAATAARCGVEAVPRTHLPSVLGALRGADLFISGGGSLLQDATSWRSVPYYAGLMRLARWMGVPVFVYAQGIGPLRRPWLRRLAARVLNGAAEVTVRDRLSYEMLLELGVNPAAVTITADPVFALAPGAPEPVATAAASPDPAAGGAPAGPAASGGPAVSAGRRGDALGPQGGRLIGLCLRPVPGPDGDAATNRVLDALAAALRLRLDEWDAYVVPLPLHPAADGP